MGEIVIIGAGPAGLMTALTAAEAGHRVTVREAGGSVGGMAGSFDVAGQRVDFGSHRLHPSIDAQSMARLRTLLGNDLQARERNGRIRLHDRWIGFPLRFINMTRNLPANFMANIARDTILSRLRKGDGAASFESELTKRLGPTITSEFYSPYSEKLYGVASRDLGSELADRRVSASSPLTIALKALRAARPAGRIFYYPRLGYGQIAERLADAAVAAGAEITLDSPVETVTASRDHASVAGAAFSSDADIVWSTMPLPRLFDALRPRPPLDVAAALGELRTRAMVLVYLVVPRSRYTAYDAHYFPDPSMCLSRLSEPKNYRSGPDPTDQTVLCAELPCWQHDDLWNSDDLALGALVSDELVAAGLPSPAHVEVQVRRMPSVYPVYEVATQPSRRIIESWIRRQRRVVPLGRQGLGVPDNVHHVLTMGHTAATLLDAAAAMNGAGWETALDTFVSHVVED